MMLKLDSTVMKADNLQWDPAGRRVVDCRSGPERLLRNFRAVKDVNLAIPQTDHGDDRPFGCGRAPSCAPSTA